MFALINRWKSTVGCPVFKQQKLNELHFPHHVRVSTFSVVYVYMLVFVYVLQLLQCVFNNGVAQVCFILLKEVNSASCSSDLFH